MTAPPRGSGLRSVGASLLDQVLAETLDPAYAQAAEARAAGVPSQRSPWRGRVLAGVTMLAAGVLVAVAYSQAAAGAEGREEIRAALVADIERESAVTDDLAAQLDELSGRVGDTREELLATSAGGQEALEELARLEAAAAAVPVTGPGLLVTLANAEADADADPVGGTAEEDPRGRVRDGDLQLVVNALWAAGAEAVSVNDQRLGPTTAIRFAGEAVLVDFRPVTNPYEIRAIGDPGRLSQGFLANPEVGALAVISETFGLRFDFAQEDELGLPAAGIPELRIARPVPPSGAAVDDPSAADPSPADPPAADPSPEG
ncbi:DUF881 domain-containing protein [Geodermatophilus sp. YIM 151500]|uniref:DUF881 domain-containing protein n=1 Tax=Geodermatophilus sp. YIM 151500 TaxID=2984531 RepID=UPI0021E4FDC3|nr:DUF881 domain-containing protein [Geodermatophilus sp. YIM 151500]MCV2489063.1 DUF881 domain-containing protein [Geodermatophilus sp. YIM 151500]